VPGHAGDSTYCHSCGKKIIGRRSVIILENRMKENRCAFCDQVIPGHFSSV
jgi:hypothetical protein